MLKCLYLLILKILINQVSNNDKLSTSVKHNHFSRITKKIKVVTNYYLHKILLFQPLSVLCCMDVESSLLAVDQLKNNQLKQVAHLESVKK